MQKRNAFSLMELMVAIAIMTILTTMAIMNYNNLRSISRDANRRDSLGAYKIAIEQYYASTKTYFISSGVINRDTWNSTDESSGTDCYIKSDGTSYRGPCTGYLGKSFGRVTRQQDNTNLPNYRLKSISDQLVDKGFLAIIRTDPMSPSTTSNSRDFYLAICTLPSGIQTKGVRAIIPSEARDYSLYTRMEKTNPNDYTSFAKSQVCGSDANGILDIVTSELDWKDATEL